MSADEKQSPPAASQNVVRLVAKSRGEGIAGLLRDLANYCEKNGVESAVIVMCSKDNDCDFTMQVTSEHHAALLALQLDDVREDLKNMAFNVEVVEDMGDEPA